MFIWSVPLTTFIAVCGVSQGEFPRILYFLVLFRTEAAETIPKSWFLFGGSQEVTEDLHV